jgi:hypothetical protein
MAGLTFRLVDRNYFCFYQTTSSIFIMASKGPLERDAVVDFANYADMRVRVKIFGGREVEGVLKGYDKLDNLVLDDTIEFMRGLN